MVSADLRLPMFFSKKFKLKVNDFYSYFTFSETECFLFEWCSPVDESRRPLSAIKGEKRLGVIVFELPYCITS